MRPYMLNIEGVKNMVVEGITLQNSAHIANMLRRIDGLVMKDVKVLNQWWSQNADGLDISACRNVLLYNCTVNTGDDGICMKSSGTPKAGEFRLENIVIKDSKVFRGHGGFVIGSNTDGGMNNIFVKNITCNWTQTGLRFKSGTGRGGRVQNIFIEDVYMKDIINEAIIFEVEYTDSGAITAADFKESDAKVPDFNGVSMKNIFCESAGKAISVKGQDEKVQIKNVSIENAIIQAETGASFSFAQGFTLDNVNILAKNGVTFLLNQTTDFTLKNLAAGVSGDFAVLMGAKTNNILFKNTSIKAENIKTNSAVQAGAFSIEK
jgi:polygalacturonase